MTAVDLRNLTKRFGGDEPAVQNLSLEIKSGEFVGLLGPSGCGKTTTLKMIAGLLYPTEGDITFDGVSVLDIATEKRGAVMVFQNHLLFPYMNVLDNIGFGLRMRKIRKDEIFDRADRILNMVYLRGFESRRPSELSGGQQQRVALARALVTEPRLLLLDEPLSNLDAHLRYEMRELILELQRNLKITTIFVTHDQQEAVILADRTALIFDGVLQQYSGPREFYENPASESVAKFFGAENFLEGVKTGTWIETRIGKMQMSGNVAADGDVIISIRPNSIVIGGDGPNTFTALVTDTLYIGTHTRIWAEVGGCKFQILGAAHDKYKVGDKVKITLPPERLLVVPRDSVGRAKTGG